MTIDSYDPATGIVTTVESLKHYHFGAATSTGDNGEFGGIDMRGEVLHMTRNIKIIGDTS